MGTGKGSLVLVGRVAGVGGRGSGEVLGGDVLEEGKQGVVTDALEGEAHGLGPVGEEGEQSLAGILAQQRGLGIDKVHLGRDQHLLAGVGPRVVHVLHGAPQEPLWVPPLLPHASLRIVELQQGLRLILAP